MKKRKINFTASKAEGAFFTIEKARNGKAVVIYNADRATGAQSGLPAGCGLVSRLAELSLTVAGMTVLGDSIMKEMEIQILSGRRGGKLEATARIVDSEENFTTAECAIRIGGKGRQKPLVARAFGTICGVRRAPPARSSRPPVIR
jgi:acyl-coenzyme A thioesterase PaaI-like protein